MTKSRGTFEHFSYLPHETKTSTIKIQCEETESEWIYDDDFEEHQLVIGNRHAIPVTKRGPYKIWIEFKSENESLELKNGVLLWKGNACSNVVTINVV